MVEKSDMRIRLLDTVLQRDGQKYHIDIASSYWKTKSTYVAHDSGCHISTLLRRKCCIRTACVSGSDDVQTALDAVHRRTALQVHEILDRQVAVFGDGVGDVGREIHVEAPRRRDYQHNVLPLEVTQDGRQRYPGRLERRRTADEVRARVAVESVVKT